MSEKTGKTDAWDIKAGTVFNTRFEKNCIALGEPYLSGNFVGFDSDGDKTQFSLTMVTSVANQADVYELILTLSSCINEHAYLLTFYRGNGAKLEQLEKLEKYVTALKLLLWTEPDDEDAPEQKAH